MILSLYTTGMNRGEKKKKEGGRVVDDDENNDGENGVTFVSLSLSFPSILGGQNKKGTFALTLRFFYS